MTKPREVHALVVNAEGECEFTYIPANGDAIREIIGGWLEAIGPQTDEFGDWHAYVDEDGAYKNYAPNHNATVIAHALGWRGVSAHPSGYLAGPAVFLGVSGSGEDFRANEGDFPNKATAKVLEMFREAVEQPE